MLIEDLLKKIQKLNPSAQVEISVPQVNGDNDVWHEIKCVDGPGMDPTGNHFLIYAGDVTMR